MSIKFHPHCGVERFKKKYPMAKSPPPIIQAKKCRRLTPESLGNSDIKSNLKKGMQGNFSCFSFLL